MKKAPIERLEAKSDSASIFLVNNPTPAASSSFPKPPSFSTPFVRSAVLDRAKAFLPQMEEANKKLSQEMLTQPKESFDIENVKEDAPYIEMNLALGVLEMQGKLNSNSIQIPGIQDPSSLLSSNKKSKSKTKSSSNISGGIDVDQLRAAALADAAALGQKEDAEEVESKKMTKKKKKQLIQVIGETIEENQDMEDEFEEHAEEGEEEQGNEEDSDEEELSEEEFVRLMAEAGVPIVDVLKRKKNKDKLEGEEEAADDDDDSDDDDEEEMTEEARAKHLKILQELIAGDESRLIEILEDEAEEGEGEEEDYEFMEDDDDEDNEVFDEVNRAELAKALARQNLKSAEQEQEPSSSAMDDSSVRRKAQLKTRKS